MIESKLNKNKPFNILWVDDNTIISKATEILVKSLGHACSNVNSGKKALDFLNTNPCDIVFTDIGMPEMNGWELADAIREKYGEEIIIIVVSGWSINNSDMTEHGVRDSLQKPFSLAHLKEVLEKLD